MRQSKIGGTPWNKGLKGAQKWTEEQHRLRKEEFVPGNRRPVSCEGVQYESLSTAKAYNLTDGAMHNRVNSKKEKYKDFYYL